MTVPICEHIKPGGVRCGSPAVRDKQSCYYHLNFRHAMPLTTMFYAERPDPPAGELPVALFDLPPLEDAASVQIGYMQVIYGLTNRHLDQKNARLILSALHGAARNLRLLKEALPRVPVEETPEKKPVESVKKGPAGVGRKRA